VDEFVLPVTRKQRSGHIINISSVAGVVGLKHCAAYGAPKFAVEGLSLSVATEVEQFGIKITVVAPASSARTFWMSGTSGGPAMSWRTARLTATLQRRGRLIMASSKGDPAKLGEGSGQNCWHGEPAETVPRLEATPSRWLRRCSRPGCRKCAPMKICPSRRTTHSKRMFEKSRFRQIRRLCSHSSFQTAAVNLTPRTGSLELPRLFKHALSTSLNRSRYRS